MKKEPKWMTEYRATLKAMTNRELLDETVVSAIPDGWDGGWSHRQGEEHRLAREELDRRLGAWLDESVETGESN